MAGRRQADVFHLTYTPRIFWQNKNIFYEIIIHFKKHINTFLFSMGKKTFEVVMTYIILDLNYRAEYSDCLEVWKRVDSIRSSFKRNN